MKGSALILFLAGFYPSGGIAQTLPDTLLQQVRAGAARFVLETDSAAVALLANEAVPIVNVTVNDRGPYRFLIDLGANVVIVRRNVLDEANGEVRP